MTEALGARVLCATREAWLEVRQRGIGASESAAILGVSPWKSSLQLYYEKRGEVPASQGETLARRIGLAFEDPIARLYGEDTRRDVHRPKGGLFAVDVHPTRPYMLATLDAKQIVAHDDPFVAARESETPVEIKTAAISKLANWKEDPPIDYLVQVHHQIAVTGAPGATLVGLIGGIILKYQDIDRDDAFLELLYGAVDDWWARFQRNEPPPADGSEATKEFLKRYYARSSPRNVTLPPEAIDWDIRRQQAKEQIDHYEHEKNEAENLIKQAMGDAAGGILVNGVVYTWKDANRQGYTVKPTTYRDFRRRGPKVAFGPGVAPSLDRTLADAFHAQQLAATDDLELDI